MFGVDWDLVARLVPVAVVTLVVVSTALVVVTVGLVVLRVAHALALILEGWVHEVLPATSLALICRGWGREVKLHPIDRSLLDRDRLTGGRERPATVCNDCDRGYRLTTG